MSTQAAAPPEDYSISVEQFARELMPLWEKPEDWFRWPPDVFALTSILLKTTGIYRYVVSPYSRTTERLRCTWLNEREMESTCVKWYHWLFGEAEELPRQLRRSMNALFRPTNRLGLYDFQLSREACTAVLHLHAVADTACGNFGIPHASGVYSRQAHFLANSLLGLTGTLSRLPKRHGVILPKMRAPQSGLTLRSFSHHLSYHQSEVNVRWRTVPWVNRDYNTVNIMVVPVPYSIDSQSFRPCRYPGQEHDVRNFDYFEYASDEPLDVSRVVVLLKKAHREANRVHLLVFPEASLTWADLNALKNALQSELKPPYQIPLVLTGLRGGRRGTSKRNQVVFSAFFADKWYDLSQDKHHRWKLDDGQIKMYALAGGLNVQNQWWEGIDVRRRHLTFIAPNGWLTLCPLICEDLAQLEPVSDLIRGVGPTLVLALLMDGPQLKHRWAARYVGVLSDDPGTSVLSVTSLGMALRSRAPGMPPDRTVALWKDRETGWETLSLADGAEAILLTISAKWNEEFTADGRSDNGSAAEFVLRGTTNLRVSDKEAKELRRRLKNGRAPLSSEPTDVFELSTFSYLVDVIMDAPSEMVRRIERWAMGEGPPIDADGRFKFFKDIWERLMIALRDEGKGMWPPPQYKYGVARLCKFVAEENEELDLRAEARKLGLRLVRWEGLVGKAAAELSRNPRPTRRQLADAREAGVGLADVPRLNHLVCLSVLWAVHNRLKSIRSDTFSRRNKEGLNARDRKAVDELLASVEECQKEHSGYQELAEAAKPARAPSKRPRAK
ncbi:MAG TPA: hypothetical protein VM914_04555 [Pyrinomonadaceae bacterium]|jgi:hypothetical protein|nr:hypothetical protein [Pyrinomonadaceae bacterium]